MIDDPDPIFFNSDRGGLQEKRINSETQKCKPISDSDRERMNMIFKRTNKTKLPPLAVLQPCRLLAALLVLPLIQSLAVAKGMKGNLEKEELYFFNNHFTPILIKYHVCTKPEGDCNSDYIICSSRNSLSCDIYGIKDETAVKELFMAVMNSKLNVSRITFWRSKYHETSFFENPLLNFVDHTGGK